MVETHVLLIILFAALLHATWNALVKGAQDKLISMTAVVLGHGPFAMLVLPVAPLPEIAACLTLLRGRRFMSVISSFLFGLIDRQISHRSTRSPAALRR